MALRANGRLVALLVPALVVMAVAVNGWSGLMPGVGLLGYGRVPGRSRPVIGTAHSPGFPTYVILGFLATSS